MSTSRELRETEKYKKYILDNFTLNEETGEVFCNRVAAPLTVRIELDKKALTVPFSHFILFLKNKKWPTPGMEVDHIDDNPLNNKPNNLKEVTRKENNDKRRGKSNRAYGRTLYGYGITVSWSKNKQLYRAVRHYSVADSYRIETGIKDDFIAYAPSMVEMDVKIKSYIAKYIEIQPSTDLDDFLE